jgi:hypothetical protein
MAVHLSTALMTSLSPILHSSQKPQIRHSTRIPVPQFSRLGFA